MLFVSTREISACLPPATGFYFSSPPQAETLRLAGTSESPAWCYAGKGTLSAAGEAWKQVIARAQIDDPLGRRGTGLVAFTSFGFDSATRPVFAVPRWVFGADSRGAWVTVCYQSDFPRPELGESLRAQAEAWARNPGERLVNSPALPLSTGETGAGAAPGIGEAPGCGAQTRWRRNTPAVAETPAPELIRVKSPENPSPENPGRQRFCANVRAATALIRQGRARKIVLARRVDFPLSDPAPAAATAASLVALLSQKYRDCWIFSVGGLVGATPEMLIEGHSESHSDSTLNPATGGVVEGGDVANTAGLGGETSPTGLAHARVLAGTARPGEKVNLLKSAKNLREHAIALASVTAPLEALAAGLKTRGPYLLELPNLTHLATDVTLPMRPGVNLFDLAGAIHPTAAVAGLPREFALDFIRRRENGRGRYAGPVGWIDSQGNGQFALALRCAEVDEYAIHAWAGAGIMPDSDPEAEFLETEAKLAPIRECLLGV